MAATAPLAALGIVGDNASPTSVVGETDERLRQALMALESQSTERVPSTT